MDLRHTLGITINLLCWHIQVYRIFFCVYFPNCLIIFFLDGDFFFGCSSSSTNSLLSTLKIVTRQKVGMSTVTWTWQTSEDSDQTKSRKVDCDSDMTNLSLQEMFFFSKSPLHEPPSSDLLTTCGGTEDRRLSSTVILNRCNRTDRRYRPWLTDGRLIGGLMRPVASAFDRSLVQNHWTQ